MLGAIIGDIVGSRWEFNPTNDYNFEWLSDQNGFTDDTICTVAVADALLHGRDFGESIHDWCNRYPHPMGGYGGRFAQWVRKAVSLGADADTLGAIVGSISEAIWGIPNEIEQAIISFLTEEMKEVVEEFYKRIS